MEDTKRTLQVAQEVSDFNLKFNAFDKSSMYGTDLISVIGLAISNNKIANLEKMATPDGRYRDDVDYSINIVFTLDKDVETRTIITEYKKTATNPNPTGDIKKDEHDVKLYANKKYSLELKNNSAEEKEILNNIENIAINGDSKVKSTSTVKGTTTTIKTEDLSGYNDFKKQIFKCTDVKYNDVGRIYYMEFEPKK